MSTPTDLLLLRAISALGMAQLQLTAGKVQEAAENIDKGIKLLQEALG